MAKLRQILSLKIASRTNEKLDIEPEHIKLGAHPTAEETTVGQADSTQPDASASKETDSAPNAVSSAPEEFNFAPKNSLIVMPLDICRQESW